LLTTINLPPQAVAKPNPTFSHSELLERKIRLVSPLTYEETPSLLTHPQLASFYPEMLFLLHCTSRASVPLMEAALHRLQQMPKDDELAAQLIPYLEEHAVEEAHHDEWLLEDLKLLGVPRQQVLSRIPPPNIVAAVGAQYYWIHHVHPVAFLGYLAALETSPIPVEAVNHAMQCSGLPAAAFRTLLVHAEADPDHAADLNRLIDGLPLLPQHSAMLGISAMSIAAAVDRAFGTILEPYTPVMLENR
jgi:hypothetical protein